MLIEFSVANFRSIRDVQTLSLVAAAGKELRNTHVLSPQSRAAPDLLRSAVVYGPNAAGKSNLIRALQFMCSFVRDSSRKGQQRDTIAAAPFAADEDSRDEPSEFEVVFVEQGVRYRYGFSVTATRVVSEWLSAWPKGREQVWFERGIDGGSWSFGANFHGQRKTWQEATRDNALFLSTAVQFNASQLLSVFDWFVKRLHVVTSYGDLDRDFTPFTARQCESDLTFRQRIVRFLAMADLGVDDIEIRHRDWEASMLPPDLPEALRDQITKDMAEADILDVRLSHHVQGQTAMKLALEEESRGTQKLFALAGPWLDVLDNGYVLVIDEMDTSLHPFLLRQLVKLFHDPQTNPNDAQLVFTTHDTSVLDNTVFRRDQIWFVEKDSKLATHAYPLTDFRPRMSESYGRGYVQGRYGALPFIGDLVA